MKPLRKRSDSSRRGGICLRNKKCTFTFFLILLFPDFIYHHLFPSNRHITEIQALQSKQKKEVEDLYARMGKARPSIVASSPVAVAGGRRRLTKSKSNKSSRSGSTHSSPHQQGIPPSYFSTKTLYSLYTRSQWQIPVFEHFFLCFAGDKRNKQTSVTPSTTGKVPDPLDTLGQDVAPEGKGFGFILFFKGLLSL